MKATFIMAITVMFGWVLIILSAYVPRVLGEEVRCFSPSPDVTVCRNQKGETVKAITQGSDGTFTVTTKKGTVRCFTMNGTVICR